MTFTLNVPLFDSGATRARVKEARQDEEAAKIQLKQTQLNISQQVRDAFADLSSAQARLANAQRQVSLAEEVFRLAKVRQDAGEGTYVEVIDAETSLATSRNSLVSAKYDYFLAFSQLQHAMGNDNVGAQK
jgi:outer membrane protein TolC